MQNHIYCNKVMCSVIGDLTIVIPIKKYDVNIVAI